MQLSLSNFYKRSDSDKFLATCKKCTSIRNKKNIEKRRANYRNFIKNNKNYKTTYKQENIEQHKAYIRKHYLKNRETIIARDIERRRNNIKRKISSALRSRLNCAIKRGQKGGSAVRDLGCSVEDLKKHLESQFQPGMTWNNWATDGWHIDHIEPLSSFNLQDPEELKKACHYTNLQPLWAEDHYEKTSSDLRDK